MKIKVLKHFTKTLLQVATQVSKETNSNYQTVENNTLLVYNLIWNKSCNDKIDCCKFVTISKKTFNDYCNNVNGGKKNTFYHIIKGLLKQHLILVDNQYHYDEFYEAKKYRIHPQYIQTIQHSVDSDYEEIEVKLSFKTREMYLGTKIRRSAKDKRFSKKVKQNTYTKKKTNIYSQYQKNCLGFHVEPTEVEKILQNRFKTCVTHNEAMIKQYRLEAKDDCKKNFDVSQLEKSLKRDYFNSIHGRMYCSNFHDLKKQYRSCLLYEGERIVELFDIKSSFLLMMCMLAQNSTINRIEKDGLVKLVIEKDVYNVLGSLIVQNYSQEKDRKWFKKEVLKWFYQNGNMKRCCSGYQKKIGEYFKSVFPQFYKFVVQYDEINGKNCLSVVCSWLENYYFVNEFVAKYIDLSIVTLHDSIWIKQSEYSKELEQSLKGEWTSLIKKIIGE